VIEKRNGVWRVVARYKGLPAVSVTIGTDEKAARKYDTTLRDLAHIGRADILQAIREGTTEIGTVHHAVLKHGLAGVTLAECGVGGRETLGALYEEWMVAVKRKGTMSRRTRRPLGEGTRKRYKEGWANFFRHHPKGRAAPIKSLTTEALGEFGVLRMEIDEVTGATVNRDLTAVQSFTRWLREKYPTALVIQPRFDKYAETDYSEDDRHLEPDEYQRLREKLPAYWHTLFDLLIHTGLRIGEAQALLCKDLTPGDVFVQRHIKTPKSKRHVPLNPAISDLMQDYIRGRRPGDAVFATYLANRNNAYHAFITASVEAGLCEGEPPNLKATHSPHSLRHAFGVSAARAGISLLEIRDLLGHSDIGVTQRYARFLPDNDRSRIQAELIGAELGVGHLKTPSEPQTLTLKNGRKVGASRKKRVKKEPVS
jgi:integrase